MVYEIQTIIRLMIETWMIVLWMIVSYPREGEGVCQQGASHCALWGPSTQDNITAGANRPQVSVHPSTQKSPPVMLHRSTFSDPKAHKSSHLIMASLPAISG